jgi:hypothetical protein
MIDQMDTHMVEKDKWFTEVEQFFSYWKKATEEIQERSLHPNECSDISEMFQQDSDGLLLRRPVGISDQEILSKLDQLDSKLNSSLAMVCTTHQKND